jgi:hypothetical protein
VQYVLGSGGGDEAAQRWPREYLQTAPFHLSRRRQSVHRSLEKNDLHTTLARRRLAGHRANTVVACAQSRRTSGQELTSRSCGAKLQIVMYAVRRGVVGAPAGVTDTLGRVGQRVLSTGFSVQKSIIDRIGSAAKLP